MTKFDTNFDHTINSCNHLFTTDCGGGHKSVPRPVQLMKICDSN